MKNKRGIVVFGGAFNPPTNTHLALAEQIICEFKFIDKVLFMPVNDYYDKKELISSMHRVNMLKEACKDNSKFEVSEIETLSTKRMCTIDTLMLVKKEYPKQNIYFVTGTDNLKKLSKWKDAEKLIKNFKFIVFERDNELMQDILNENELLLTNKDNFFKLHEPIRTNCSSTIIRSRIKENKSFRYLIPEEVYKYIQQNNIYENIGERWL